MVEQRGSEQRTDYLYFISVRSKHKYFLHEIERTNSVQKQLWKSSIFYNETLDQLGKFN